MAIARLGLTLAPARCRIRPTSLDRLRVGLASAFVPGKHRADDCVHSSDSGALPRRKKRCSRHVSACSAGADFGRQQTRRVSEPIAPVALP